MQISKRLAETFRTLAERFDPPARLPLWEIRNRGLEDHLADTFGVRITLRGLSTVGRKQVLHTLGIEYFDGCASQDYENPCPTKLDVVEDDIVYVKANPYGNTAPFIALVTRVTENKYRGNGIGVEYHTMDLTGRSPEMIPCGCHIRKLDNIPFDPIPRPHWDGNLKAAELHDAWWSRKPSTPKDK